MTNAFDQVYWRLCARPQQLDFNDLRAREATVELFSQGDVVLFSGPKKSEIRNAFEGSIRRKDAAVTSFEERTRDLVTSLVWPDEPLRLKPCLADSRSCPQVCDLGFSHLADPHVPKHPADLSG